MRFISKASLGKRLAKDVLHMRGTDAVVICLNEASLMTCLQLAKSLRAWVYPLLFVPVFDAAGRDRIGAVGQDGKFTIDPAGPLADVRLRTDQLNKLIEAQTPRANEVLNQELSKYEMRLDKAPLRGRNIIIAASSLTDELPLAVATTLLEDIRAKSITTVIGNASQAVAELVQIVSDKSHILDVMTGVGANDDRYFERVENYSKEEQRAIAKNIATYWQ